MDARFEFCTYVGHDGLTKATDVWPRKDAPVEAGGCVVITFERFACRSTTGLVGAEGKSRKRRARHAAENSQSGGDAGPGPVIRVDVDLEGYSFHYRDLGGACWNCYPSMAGVQEKSNAAATLLPSPARTLKRSARCLKIHDLKSLLGSDERLRSSGRGKRSWLPVPSSSISASSAARGARNDCEIVGP